MNELEMLGEREKYLIEAVYWEPRTEREMAQLCKTDLATVEQILDRLSPYVKKLNHRSEPEYTLQETFEPLLDEMLRKRYCSEVNVLPVTRAVAGMDVVKRVEMK